MNNLKFEQLPSAVSELLEKLDVIEGLLRNQSSQEPLTPLCQFLTVREAAKYLNLAVPTVYSLVNRGELPYMKRSKRLYFLREELIEYIKVGRKQSIAEVEENALGCLVQKGRRSHGQ